MEVSERLGRARNNQQLTQLEVAQRLHVSRQTISNWETGRSYPDIASLLSLADLYRLSLDSLLKEDAKMIEDVKKKERERRGTRVIVMSSLAVDLTGLGMILAHVFKAPGFGMGRLTAMLLVLLVCLNVIVLEASAVRYQQLSGATKGTKMTLLTILFVLMFVIAIIATLTTNLALVLGIACGGLVACLLWWWLVRLTSLKS
ncbi:helix-turn-helix domain-containing protein [Secundilactobacillus kimchicus]|uniref:helix-turn-helix domain-containing protein n=1 Tax=Secundilactobacillus kimchicus TaxID=528209 RepID=UPI001C00B045|nr:helix-turn-helix transcriptional regulator [Secundilactobacillus kimchicus]